MRDNLLFKEIIAVVNAGLVANDFVGVTIPNTATKQSFQPTQEGVDNKPAVYIHKIDDHRYGWTKKTDIWDEETDKMVHEEQQIIETRFQVSALVRQKATATTPSASDKITASDLVNCVAGILQSDFALQTLRSKGIGIYRIMDIRNPYFIDDKGQNEASPSFDFTVTHNQDILNETPVLETIEYNFERV